MDIRKTRTCEKCKAVVLLEKVRLYPVEKDKNLLVCESCCEGMKKVQQVKTTEFSSKVAPLPPPEYGLFLCNRCDYTFRADNSKVGVTFNLHCPYCGETDRLQKKR